MMYHVDFMIKELIRVSLLSLIKENKISVMIIIVTIRKISSIDVKSKKRF